MEKDHDAYFEANYNQKMRQWEKKKKRKADKTAPKNSAPTQTHEFVPSASSMLENDSPYELKDTTTADGRRILVYQLKPKDAS